MRVLLSSNAWPHSMENEDFNLLEHDYRLNKMGGIIKPWNKEIKIIHIIGRHTINPFDNFRTHIGYTIQKVCKLLHSLSSSLNIHWTELHDRLAYAHIKKLLTALSEEETTPTLHELYLLVKEQTEKQLEPKELLALLDLSATLELIENESLPLRRMFNGHTDIPCYEGVKVLYMEGEGVLQEYIAPYLAICMDHLSFGYPILNEPSLLSSTKSDFPSEEFESFFKDPCYSLVCNWNSKVTQ